VSEKILISHILSIKLYAGIQQLNNIRTSISIIENRAKKVQAACVFEPARPGVEYVIRRKGVDPYFLTVAGRAAHAGAQPEDGHSAIEELAHIYIDNWADSVYKGSKLNYFADKTESILKIKSWHSRLMTHKLPWKG
jgi:hypothetical protein